MVKVSDDLLMRYGYQPSADRLVVDVHPKDVIAKEPLKAERDKWTLIDSLILGDKAVVVENERAAELAPKGLVVYTFDEIRKMKGMSLEDVKAVHVVKKIFGGKLISG
jgi:hypothetical protein